MPRQSPRKKRPAAKKIARIVDAETAELVLRGASLWAWCVVYDDPRDDPRDEPAKQQPSKRKRK